MDRVLANFGEHFGDAVDFFNLISYARINQIDGN